MNYDGQPFIVPLGQAGLFTDAPQSYIPVHGLIRANNLSFYNNVLQKDFGSRIWNSSPLPGSVVRAKETFTDSQSQNQRVFALCADGNLYKFNNYFTKNTVTPATASEPVSLNYTGMNCMATGGAELANRDKKFFLFNGHDIPQVVSADTNVRHNMSKPALDWTGTNQPFGAIVHRGVLIAWGNPNNPHAVYASNPLDHEDFQTNGTTEIFNIYPGEFDGIVCMAVFRGRLFAFKYPLGVYYLVDTDPSISNWYFTKQDDTFGACSPQSATAVQDDLLIANNYGSITSMKAALMFGDLMQKDVFYQTYNYRFAEQEVRPDARAGRNIIYYEAKRQVLCSFQSNIGYQNDRLAVIDFKDQSNPPKVSWTTKDQPNCLFTVRDNIGVIRPFYGSSDGNLYQMGVSDRWVGSATDTTKQTAYLFDAQTPHMDFGQGSIYTPGTGNNLLSVQVKEFDFLEIEYEPTGDWDVSVDVYIDGRFSKTYTCNLGARSNLGQMPLNASPIDGLSSFFRRLPIGGQGRTISLRFYNQGLGQDVRLVKAVIYYRLSGQQQMVK